MSAAYKQPHKGVRSLLASYGDSNVWPGGLLQATVRFWPDFADIKHGYTQAFYQSYSSIISQCLSQILLDQILDKQDTQIFEFNECIMLSTNFMTAKFPQASRASGSWLSTGPTGNLLAIGVGSVLISQTDSVIDE